MAAGSGKPSTGIEQGEGLGQAVGAKSLTHAFLTGEQGVIAIQAAGDRAAPAAIRGSQKQHSKRVVSRFTWA